MGRPRIDKDQSEANKKYIGIEIETLENTSKKTEKDRNCYVKSWLKWLKCLICLQWFNETYFNLQNLSITDRNWCRLNMKQIWRLKKMIYSKCCISIGSEENVSTINSLRVAFLGFVWISLVSHISVGRSALFLFQLYVAMLYMKVKFIHNLLKLVPIHHLE